MLLCTTAPERQRQESHHHCLTASLLQPFFEKVDHQGRDAGPLVDHEMAQPAVQFRGNPAVQHGDIGGGRLPAEGLPLAPGCPRFQAFVRRSWHISSTSPRMAMISFLACRSRPSSTDPPSPPATA